MKIYIDADACPVTRIAERVAKERDIPVVLLCDTNHVLNSDYSEIRVIGAGADAVDIGPPSPLARARRPSIRADDGIRMRTSTTY